jgi:tetratricopeptide (TPR) repeat protein
VCDALLLTLEERIGGKLKKMPKSKGPRKLKGKPKKKQGISKGKLLNLPSRKSMEGMMSDFFGGGGPSQPGALDRAQEIMYDAWEATTRQQRVTLAKKALKLSRDCADAYVLLAEETAKFPDEAVDLYQKGVEAGERAIGKNAFKEDVGYFWGLLETRPYMRARAGLAQSLWDAGDREQAVEHYWDMLQLNPTDNQGIRDVLMPCLIEMGRDGDAEKLFKQYKEDGMAVWMYSRALLDFRKKGDSPAATKSLKAALEENKHVPAYLLGRKKIPRHLPDYYGFGDENEAVVFAHGNRSAWEATRGALEWLASKVE